MQEKSEQSVARVQRVLPTRTGGWVPSAAQVHREPATDVLEPPGGQGGPERPGEQDRHEGRDGYDSGGRLDGPSVPRDGEPSSPGAGQQGAAEHVPDLRAALRAAVAARFPTALSGARVSPGRRGWRALVAVAVIAALVSGGVWWRSRSVPTAMPPVASSAPVAVTAGTGTSGSTASPAKIVVDVAGKVRRPGVVRLAAGARVYEAIRAAGGLRKGAKTTGLNLARKLSDGEQVVVGKPRRSPGTATGGQASPGGQGAKLPLNTATVAQLDELPGIGPVLAQRIVDYRTKNGGFKSIGQLKDVSGIGDVRYADLAPKVQV